MDVPMKNTQGNLNQAINTFPDSGKNREEKAEASGAPPDKYCGQPRPPTSLPPRGKMAAPGSRHADFRLVLSPRAGCGPRQS